MKPVEFAENLDEFLSPRSFALIGVSGTPGRPGYSLFKKVRAKMEQTGGKVMPVNPKVAEIDGIRCYPRLADIAEPIDVAVIMVGDVIPALEECVAAKVKYVRERRCRRKSKTSRAKAACGCSGRTPTSTPSRPSSTSPARKSR